MKDLLGSQAVTYIAVSDIISETVQDEDVVTRL